MWWVLFVAVTANAEMPLPSYRDELVRKAWLEADELLEAGHLEEAAASAKAFEDQVTPDGTLEYLIGLSWRLRDEPRKAEKHYREALSLDPDLPEAWSDLGEILLVQGRLDEADDAFQKVEQGVPNGPYAWLGPQRLAEIGALRHDPEAFERHIHDALRKGFSFQTVVGLPNWRAFYADPAMHDSVEKMITVYGDPDILDSLKAPPPPQ